MLSYFGEKILLNCLEGSYKQENIIWLEENRKKSETVNNTEHLHTIVFIVTSTVCSHPNTVKTEIIQICAYTGYYL